MSKRKVDKWNNVFYRLADGISALRASNGLGDITKIDEDKLQEKQVNLLMKLERKFKKQLYDCDRGIKVYQDFMDYFNGTTGNLRNARPMFREPSGIFGKKVSPAIKTNNIKELSKYCINYRFIQFIKERWETRWGKFPKDIQQTYSEIVEVRRLLIENNIPLAINRAKLFFNKVKKPKGTLIDYINTCVLGLICGIDKWYGPYNKVFRSTCIGRMTGNMIEIQSATMLHFYPSDRKTLYRINLTKARGKIDTLDELIEGIKKSDYMDNDEKTKENLLDMINAADIIDTDNNSEDNLDYYSVYNKNKEMNEHENVEEKVSKIDALRKVLLASDENLTLLEKKILRLKGIGI
jgi:hypothetical protein